ncbi:MAG: TolC family protein [Thermoanaerobaculaceae bacterium]|jgi:outer membrane protein TolC
MRTRSLKVGMAAVIGAMTMNAWAAEPRFEVGTAPGQQTRGARLGAPEMRLSLQDAVALALAHNINLEVSRLGLASSREGLLGSTGIFDPVLSSSLSGSYSESPSTNSLTGAEVGIQRGREFDLSLGALVPTGGTYSIGWTNTRSFTNSSFYFLNPTYSSGLLASLKQPLLKGFGTDVNRAAIEVARRNKDISQVGFEEVVISTAQSVESAYWNLVYTIDYLRAKQHSLMLAQDLLEQTRTRVRIGTLAPIDIVQPEAAVAAREVDIIQAENAIGNAGDVLKGLIGFENPEDWKSRIVPTDALEATTEDVDLDKAIAAALEKRPELRQRQLELEIREVNLLVARNAVKPELDLSLNYGFSGVGGDTTGVDPLNGQVIPFVSGGWSDPLSQIYHRDYSQWAAMVSVSYPLGNHQAKAQLAQRRFDETTARQNIALQRQAVIQDVRTAVRGLEASAKGIAAAVKSRELAERNLDAEQKKFANGMSTNFEVVKVQDDLAAAQAAELQARVLYRQAVAAYRVASGVLLDEMGIAVKGEPEAPEPHTALKDVGFLQFGHCLKDQNAAAAPKP